MKSIRVRLIVAITAFSLLLSTVVGGVLYRRSQRS